MREISIVIILILKMKLLLPQIHLILEGKFGDNSLSNNNGKQIIQYKNVFFPNSLLTDKE